MEHSKRDSILREKILGENADIEAFTAGMSREDFFDSKVAQKAVMMSLINIGELSKSFSASYFEATSAIPWRDIRGLRNIAAHHYEAIRLSNIWLTLQEDIPELKRNLLKHPVAD